MTKETKWIRYTEVRDGILCVIFEEIYLEDEPPFTVHDTADSYTSS